MATKFKTKSFIARRLQEIISETFASNRGFSGSGYRMMSMKFYNDRPWLPWQRKLRQSAITRPLQEIYSKSLRITGDFLGRAIEWCHPNSTTTNLCCHGNQIWDEIGYNSACVRDMFSNRQEPCHRSVTDEQSIKQMTCMRTHRQITFKLKSNKNPTRCSKNFSLSYNFILFAYITCELI